MGFCGVGLGGWGLGFFFFTLVTGPRRSLSLKLSDTRVYEPQFGVGGRPRAPASSPRDAESPYARKGRWGEGAAGEASCAFAARLFHGGVTTLPRLLRVAGCMVLPCTPVEWIAPAERMGRNVSVRRLARKVGESI